MRTILTLGLGTILMLGATSARAQLRSTQQMPILKPGKHYVIEIQKAVLNRFDPETNTVEKIPVDLTAGEAPQHPRIREFDTFSDAIFAATDGWVHLPSDATPQDFSLSDGVSAATSTVIAIDYDGTFFGGSSLTWTVSNSLGCNTYKCGFLNLSTCWYNYSNSALGADWNDRISSTSGGGGCSQNVLWENQNFGGSRLECNASCSTLGIMDNQASSRKWCSSAESSFCN